MIERRSPAGTPRRSIPWLLAASLAWLPCGLPACDRGADAPAERAPITLDDATMVRLLNCLRELRALGPSVAATERPDPIAGSIESQMAYLLGPQGDQVLARHGFESRERFAMLYHEVRRVLQRVLLDEAGGFGGAQQAYSLRASIEEANEQLKQLDADPLLTEEEKAVQRVALRARIERLEGYLAEVDEMGADMREQFEDIPQESIDTVTRHFQALRAVLAGSPLENVEAPHGGREASQLLDEGEVHLANLRQLTFGGENAEAYFSFAGDRLVYQATAGDLGCDQIFVMDADGADRRMVSTGLGRTTCAYFLPGDREVIYASTHLADEACPPEPDRSQGYVWPIYPGYDLFKVDLESGALTRLTDSPGYDAEATVSPDGTRIVFTSTRDGDLDLYVMNVDGTDVRRLTDEVGYDGGAFFSPDSSRIVYRAHHPQTEEETARYRELLAQGLIEPRRLEIFVMNADGSAKRRVTDLGKASFCPYFTPDGRRIVFSSNIDDPRGREFDLYLVDLDGGNLERVTYTPEFDGFPMFSPDGTKLVFASNRGGTAAHETNVFIADWRP